MIIKTFVLRLEYINFLGGKYYVWPNTISISTDLSDLVGTLKVKYPNGLFVENHQ